MPAMVHSWLERKLQQNRKPWDELMTNGKPWLGLWRVHSGPLRPPLSPRSQAGASSLVSAVIISRSRRQWLDILTVLLY